MTVAPALEQTHPRVAQTAPTPPPTFCFSRAARISKQTQPTLATHSKAPFPTHPPHKSANQTQPNPPQHNPSQMQPDATKCNLYAQCIFALAQLKPVLSHPRGNNGHARPDRRGGVPLMPQPPRDSLIITPRYQPLFAALGLTAQTLFTDPRIIVWRSITERQNCTLDLPTPTGQITRLHVKRFEPARGPISPAQAEARGIQALEIEQIPTAPLVAFGTLADGRSVVVTEDLAGFRAGDKCIATSADFECVLQETADLAARLHQRGLHHRDLYLCHFFIKDDAAAAPPELRLIDAARVARLPRFLTRQRWIVKDLAQFWYSTTAHPITDDQRTRWLARYAQQRQLSSTTTLKRSIQRKAAWIARHDQKLKRAQPTRNVSIPGP
jgi:heptose I phosphotransferase